MSRDRSKVSVGNRESLYQYPSKYDNIKKYIPNYNHILVDVNGTRDLSIIKENLNKYTIFFI